MNLAEIQKLLDYSLGYVRCTLCPKRWPNAQTPDWKFREHIENEHGRKLLSYFKEGDRVYVDFEGYGPQRLGRIMNVLQREAQANIEFDTGDPDDKQQLWSLYWLRHARDH